MDKLDIKLSAVVVLAMAVISFFFDIYLSLSLILGFTGFIGYYFFLQKRIDSFLKNQNKFIFYLSIVLSILTMSIPFIIMTLISPTALHYAGCAVGFIVFKVVLEIKGFMNK